MTMTEPTATETGDPTALAVTLPTRALRAVLAGTEMFRSADQSRPILTAWELRGERDGDDYKLTATGTDSYMLATIVHTATVLEDAPAPVEFTATFGNGAKWADLGAFAKARPREFQGPDRESVDLTVSGQDAYLTWNGSTARLAANPGEFPVWQSLIPADDQDRGTLPAFDPARLAAIHKGTSALVKAGMGAVGTPVRLSHVDGPHKPTVWKWSSCESAVERIDARFLIMPVRTDY